MDHHNFEPCEPAVSGTAFVAASERSRTQLQVMSLRSQLDFQTSEVRHTAEQEAAPTIAFESDWWTHRVGAKGKEAAGVKWGWEVALMKQEFERRERSLVQMLEQAGLGRMV